MRALLNIGFVHFQENNLLSLSPLPDFEAQLSSEIACTALKTKCSRPPTCTGQVATAPDRMVKAGPIHLTKPTYNIKNPKTRMDFCVPGENKQCVVKVAERVAMKRHMLGARELHVRVHLECLGPSGGRKDPYVLPEALELSVSSNIKIRFLQRSPAVLKSFNECLSNVHAFARLTEDALKVDCTLNESEPEAYILVKTWRDKVVNTLDTCFQLVRIDRIDVVPDIWSNVLEIVKTCDIRDDLLLLLSDEHSLVILSQTDKEGDTAEKINAIVKNEENKFALKNCEVSETKDLSQHEVDFLITSSFQYEVMAQFNTLRVDIREQERKITFCGFPPDVKEAQLKMLEMLRSLSMLEIRLTEDKISILAHQNTGNRIREKLTSSGLVASWEVQAKSVVKVYCARGTDLQKAIEIIQLSLAEETLPLDEVSLEVIKMPLWTQLKNQLIQENNGLLSITLTPHALKITAFSDIFPDVKKTIVMFMSEHSTYTTVFRFSPSRHKFLALFWEERLNDIVEKQSKKVEINLDNQKRNIIVKGTNQGIETVRTKLEELEKTIVCSEEIVTKQETVLYFKGLKNLTELEFTARAHQCVISLAPEEAEMKIVATNQPVKETVTAERLQQDGKVLPSDSARALLSALTTQKQRLTTLRSLTVVLNDSAAVCAFIDVLRSERKLDTAAKTTVCKPLQMHREHRIDFGEVHLIIKQGDITEEDVDAIVISANQNFDLTLVADMRKHKVVMTSAPNLKCRHIVHIDGEFYVKSNNWEKAYRAVLVETEKKGLHSIAVPAIGTGACQLFPRHSARALANALTTHQQTMKTLQHVTVVVTDEETAQAFIDILSLKAKEDAFEIVDLFEPPQEMNVGFSTDVGGVQLTIKQGDITEEEVDAIKAYTAALQEAERLGFHSLAVPALGTGACQLSPSESAQALANALCVQRPTLKTLRYVTVVVVDSATMKTFRDVLGQEKQEDAAEKLSMSGKDGPEKKQHPRAIEKIGNASNSSRNTPDVFKLYIFSTNQARKAEFCKALYDFVDAKYDCREIKNVNKLSPGEVTAVATELKLEQVMELCKSLNVDIQKKAAGVVVLKGLTEDVKRCRERIKTLVKERERQRQETMMANLVQWHYFEKTSGTGWKAFGGRENLAIEEAFHAFQNEQNSETLESSDNDQSFVLNFTEMKKYDKRNPYDGVRIMRKEIIKGGASFSSLLPEEWEVHGVGEDLKRVHLPHWCTEYQRVRNNFLKTAEGVLSLLTIVRVQNPELYIQYLAKKAQMEKQNKGMHSEKTLWHGTANGAIRNINRYGFNRSFCGKNAALYGQGVYFAVRSSYSMHGQYSPPDSVGRRYIYQCKVLVGYALKGTDQMKFLPRRDDDITYDSATNDEDNPEMYIIFHDSQAYPEYLIVFQ
ncbi:hypothetical protein C0Q70_11329 [Pomacea canaliculata]|uniref:Poly [ADP-ribose] polymerase n=1 Tax=Pomacea canaliculata TaxID=400727 RepID=A0A2T7P5N1_POMCA|nr:hypothetical protein C0Q70_11329 [Pomacea canaliculata]